MNDDELPKLMRIEFVATPQRRFVRACNDMIAELIRNFAIDAKVWRVRVSSNMACGLTEFWSPHGLVEVELVVTKRSVFEIEGLPK